MAKTFSFTLIEKELVPEFRKKVNGAESVADLKNLFSQTGIALFRKALSPEIHIAPREIVFAPGEKELFLLSAPLSGRPEIRELLSGSDLLKVMARFAKSLNRRYLHLQKHSQKTNLKIRK